MTTSKLLKISLLVIHILLLTSCQNKNKTTSNFPQDSLIFFIAKPIILENLKTDIHLEDFILELKKIDSITLNKNFKAYLSNNGKILTLTYNDEQIPYITDLIIWSKGFQYNIPMIKTFKKKYTFKFNPQNKKYKNVRLTGDMFNWDKYGFDLTQKDSIWEITMLIYPGKYHYQLILDEKWSIDYTNPQVEPDEKGKYNSVLYIPETIKDSLPHISTISYNEDVIKIYIDKPYEELFIYWNNFKLNNNYLNFKGNFVDIKIPQESKKIKRTYIRCYAYNKHGISNDLLIPLEYGQVLDKVEQISSYDHEAKIMYFILVDRFFNGNKSNDKPINDPSVPAKVNYMGGDLAGIIKKIEEKYFQKLGINTLCISPVTQNPEEAYIEYSQSHEKLTGYHGYWPISFSQIDYRLGNNEEFNKLVTIAHKNNLSILLDYVVNYVHKKHHAIIKNPQWATPLILHDDRKNIRLWDKYRFPTWMESFLPTLNLEDSSIIAIMTDSIVYWLKKFNIDGFKYNTTKYTPKIFLRELTKKIKKQYSIPTKKKIYQIGETFDSKELVRNYISTGMLDAQFDFNLYFNMCNVFAKNEETFIKLKNSLDENFQFYGYHHLMGNISGYYNLPRFVNLISETNKPEKYTSKANWKKNISTNIHLAYAKLKMFFAFISTIPGIPVIYYGDEIGLPGTSDDHKMMKFENLSYEENSLKQTVEKLLNFRKNNLSLIFGEFIWINVDLNTMIFMRKYFDKEIFVLFNKSNEIKKLSFKIPEKCNLLSHQTLFNSHTLRNYDTLTVTLAPYSFDIVYEEN